MQRMVVVCFAVLVAFAVLVGARQDATSSETDSQVVDNSDGDRFAASRSWKASDSGTGINGDDYLVARPAKKGAHALFEVPIPENGVYAVYVRWPKVSGLNDRVPVGVESPYGTKWTEVDQRENGGEWVRIGEFEMRKDQTFPVRISHNTRGRGKVAADAVKVEMVSSYEDFAAGRTESAAPSEATRSTAAATGQNVANTAMRLAQRFKDSGVHYKYRTCTSTLMSCTCFTKKVFARFGYNLSMSLPSQARMGRPVSRANLRPGDLVIFDENQNGVIEDWDHVGVYVGRNPSTGQQMISHSSIFFNTTVTSEMRYLVGYAGARRLV